ncbi:DUF3800 domain-containing protein [Ascidiaceihabitans sp.]|uniref:DUF3800 domain-containing protein n=1 Tax=Ascidiaceihabitans sp. TaxID=1872644 RepID=UPI003296C237
MENFYLDESGNTGDVTLSAPDFTFSDQPFFVLSCVGVSDEQSLAIELMRLKQKHKIQGPELKFRSVSSKPKFMLDLLSVLKSQSCPIFIEATNKRYTLLIHMIECLIVPPISPSDFGPEATYIKNIFSDWMWENVDDQTLNEFCIACNQRSKSSVIGAFEALENLINRRPANDITAGILRFLKDTKVNFLNESGQEESNTMRLLPIPDTLRSGKLAQILPHVPSLLHIYGRLNRHFSGELSSVILFHDEQLQFDRALREGMALAESEVGNGLPTQPLADFKFHERANLQFQPSHQSAGIQVADMLAGMVNFGLQEISKSHSSNLPTSWRQVFHFLFAEFSSRESEGVNVVAASKVTQKFFEETSH